MSSTKKTWGLILSLILPASWVLFDLAKWSLKSVVSEAVLFVILILIGFISFLGIFVLPIGLFLLLKYWAEKKGKPKAWYARGWMLLPLFVLAFGGYFLIKSGADPAVSQKFQQAVDDLKSKEKLYDETIQARLNEIEKEVPGLGVECYNGLACHFMIIFYFDSLPGNYHELIYNYTLEFAKIKQKIFASPSLSNITVAVRRGSSKVYECTSGKATAENPDAISVSCSGN